jgi:hypothetical protein
LLPRLFADNARHQSAGLDTDWLVNDPTALWVIADFNMALKWEILAERMADKAVVGEDATQVGMAIEEYAEQVEYFPLIPVSHWPDLYY